MSYPVPQGYTTQVVNPAPPRSSAGHIVIAWVLTVCTLGYLLPWAVAASRGKRNVGAIALINLFLGWSLIGWVAALVMACLNDDRPAAVIITQQPTGTAYFAAQPPNYSYPPARSALATPPADWPQSQPTAPYLPPIGSGGYSSGPLDEPTQVIRDPNAGRTDYR